MNQPNPATIGLFQALGHPAYRALERRVRVTSIVLSCTLSYCLAIHCTTDCGAFLLIFINKDESMSEKQEYLSYVLEGTFLMPGNPELGPEPADKVGFQIKVTKADPPDEPVFTLCLRVPRIDVRSGNVKWELLSDSTEKKVRELIDTNSYRPGAEYFCDLLDLDGSCTLREKS